MIVTKLITPCLLGIALAACTADAAPVDEPSAPLPLVESDESTPQTSTSITCPPRPTWTCGAGGGIWYRWSRWTPAYGYSCGWSCCPGNSTFDGDPCSE